MKNKTVYVIKSRCEMDEQAEVIGVVSDTINVDMILNAYFGEDLKLVDFRDVRDSGIVFVKTISIDSILFYITVLSFNIDEV